jgi:Ca-activated chloride channel family protein
MQISCALEKGIHPRAGGTVVLGVSCSHGTVRFGARPDLSIAAALDRSASMKGGTKLADMKAATRMLVESLGPRDRLVLVAFDSGAEVLAAGPVVEKQSFMEAIDSVECRSGTNISLALETAGRFLEGDRSGNVKRLLLLTDGEASKGDTSAIGLARRAEQLARSEIVTTCLGFGLEYDEDTLSLIAGAGAGRFHHVSEQGKLTSIYERELERMRSLVAPWMSVTVTPQDGARVLGSRNNYPMKRLGSALELELSDLTMGEARWVLFDVAVAPTTPQTDEARLCDVTVRWKDHQGAERDETQHVSVKYADDATARNAELNGEVLVQMALLDAAAAKECALDDVDAGTFTVGSERLENTLERIAGTTARFGDQRVFRELARMKELARRLAAGEIDPEARKVIREEIHEGRTPTFRIDLGDAPPI